MVGQICRIELSLLNRWGVLNVWYIGHNAPKVLTCAWSPFHTRRRIGQQIKMLFSRNKVQIFCFVSLGYGKSYAVVFRLYMGFWLYSCFAVKKKLRDPAYRGWIKNEMNNAVEMKSSSFRNDWNHVW